MSDFHAHISSAWDTLAQTYHLTPHHVQQFQSYSTMLQSWNERFNITARTDTHDIIADHFYDSLALSTYVDLSGAVTIADVGTGGGFPGLPLKVVYPHIGLILIEVNAKKREFLDHVVKQLGLKDVIISDLDWRTFVRKTSYPVDFVVARASLQPVELLRMFRPASAYNQATLVYWASAHWQPGTKESTYVSKDILYSVDHKTRRLIFFKQPQLSQKS